MNFFKKISFFWITIISLLLPGITVAIMRCMLRVTLERSDYYVETLADFDEFRELARKDGITLDELFYKLKENGASSVAISEDTLSSLESEGKITVLTSKEIRKLSLEETFEIKLPTDSNTLGGLWVHSDDDKLLDRISQNLSWKLSDKALIRNHKNLLLINKSDKGIMNKVGLGFSKEYFDLAEKYGLGVVIRVFNYPGLNAQNASKIIDSFPLPTTVSALIFADEEMFGMRGELNEIIELFKNRSYRIGWIEFDIQEGIKNYLNKLTSKYPFIRVHAITRKEMDQVYTPDRAIARWVRAVKDRSIKMLYFNCFLQDEKKYVPNFTELNLKYLNDTVNELKKSGFKIASNDLERRNEPRRNAGKPSFAESIIICVALILGLAMLLKLSFLPTMSDFSSLIFVIFAVIFVYISPQGFPKVAGLIGAISYSCLGYLLATKAIENNNHSFIFNSIRYLILLIVPSIIGGILIAGLYSSSDYLLKFNQFHGIKLAFLIPLLFSFTWSLKNFGGKILSLLQKPMTIITALILVAVVASLFLYIIRSDNTTLLKPTALEDRGRTFLENTLIARPRNKEFLVGYPAALLFVMLLMRKELILLPVLSVFIQMGQVSVVNTFCHFHTPLEMTLLRTVNGIWLGIIIGLMLVLAWQFVHILMIYGQGKEKRLFLVGYFGFGNLGDELLRETYTNKLEKELKDYKISVLIGKEIPKDNSENINWIPRKNFTSVIEEIIKSEALIIPGGGVFQSVTSNRSLFYYLLIIWLAKKLGTKVILPAQGLGPWKRRGIISKLLHKKVGDELRNAEYLTVRDNESVEKFKKITSPEAYVELTTDLAFLNDKFLRKKHKGKIEFMRIYAVLRSSVKGSTKIASNLIKLAADSENIELIPVAFQPGEDAFVWRRAGWKGDIKNVESFERVFDGADLVVSMRLHGCIIATKLGIPWIGLAYNPKVSSLADAIGWNDYCKIPDEADEDFFEKCINKLAYDYTKSSNKLYDYAEKMRVLAEKDFHHSCEVITKDKK